MVNRRFWLSLLGCLLMSVGLASVESATRSYFTESRDKTLESLAEASLPNGSAKRGSSFVFLNLGASRFDFFALATPADSAHRFAQACDRALQAAGMPELKVVYGQERGQAVLDTDYDHYGLGITSASLSLDIGRFRDSLEKSGFTPSIVLARPRYAEISGVNTEPAGKGRKSYYNLAAVSGRVTVTESVEPLELVCLGFFAFGLPVILLVGFTLASRVGRREDLPKEVRFEQYKRLVMGSAFGGIAVHFPIFIWLISTGAMSRLTELWLGSEWISIFSLWLLLPLPLLSYAAKRMKAVEAPLMDTTVGAMEAIEREQRRRNGPRFLVGLVTSMPIAFVGIWGAKATGNPRWIAIVPVGVFVAVIAMSYMDHAAKRRDGQAK